MMCTVLSIAKGLSLSGLLQFQQSKMVYRSFERLPSLQFPLLKMSDRSNIGLTKCCFICIMHVVIVVPINDCRKATFPFICDGYDDTHSLTRNLSESDHMPITKLVKPSTGHL